MQWRLGVATALITTDTNPTAISSTVQFLGDHEIEVLSYFLFINYQLIILWGNQAKYHSNPHG